VTVAGDSVAASLTTVPAEVARVVAAFGIRAFFGLSGSGNYFLTHELRDAGLAYYATAHEAGSVAMADGYARTTGTIGVATVHQGPGLTNAVTALREAVRSHSPLVLLAADVPQGATDHNQHVDQLAVARSIDAGVERVGGADVVIDRVTSAFRRAAGEQRPIVVMLPIDGETRLIRRRLLDPRAHPLPEPAAPAEATVRRAAELLLAAQRPVVLAGWGAARNPEARDAIAAVADCIEAPLLTTTRAHSLFAGHRLNAGVAGGFGTERARQALRTADVVLVLGASMNPWTLAHDDGLTERAQVIQVDTDAAQMSSRHGVAVPIVADCVLTVRCVLSLIRDIGRESTIKPQEDAATESPVDAPADRSGDTSAIDPRALT
jgi:acetolactate synthase I/II/III large subunit